jgi:hypothetical protein
MSDAVNLYAPPKARVADVSQVDGEAAEIRTEHIKTEASIRAVGTLYYIGGAALCFAAVVFLVNGASIPQRGLFPGIGVFLLAFGVLALFVARGLRKFRPWARIATIVLSALNVLGVLRNPLGALIAGYIIYLLLSSKGRRIFQDDYQDIIAATPDIKYKTSNIVWIALGVLLLLLVAIGVMVALRR